MISFNLHNRVSFYVTIKTRGNNPILTLKPNNFLHISSTSTLISINLHNRVSFFEMIKTRGNNPILTLKPNNFLHILPILSQPASDLQAVSNIPKLICVSGYLDFYWKGSSWWLGCVFDMLKLLWSSVWAMVVKWVNLHQFPKFLWMVLKGVSFWWFAIYFQAVVLKGISEAGVCILIIRVFLMHQIWLFVINLLTRSWRWMWRIPPLPLPPHPTTTHPHPTTTHPYLPLNNFFKANEHRSFGPIFLNLIQNTRFYVTMLNFLFNWVFVWGQASLICCWSVQR